MAWKTARFRVAQAGPYDQLQPSINADKLSGRHKVVLSYLR
jgi:hypothetical protein